jgi:deazaflavin-dependent oxidoreductase (nitroreductase family)
MNDYVDETVTALDDGELPGWISDHVRAYQASGGAQGHMWDSTAVGGSGLVPCLLLTTVGRRSGKHYTHPLLYGVDGDRFIIVASKGGADTQPQWYFNLLAHTAVTVQVQAEVFTATAAKASGQERSRLWTLMTTVYPPYLEYQAKTAREIPIFVLERSAT